MATDTTRRGAGRPWRLGRVSPSFLKEQGSATATVGDLAPGGGAGFPDVVLALTAASDLGRALPAATTCEWPASVA